MLEDGLREQARRWRADDPDPHTRAQLDDLIARADGGDTEAVVELTAAFDGVLEFGTAGLRAALGPGPRRINQSTVRLASAGLARYLAATGGRRVIVGFDARHRSHDFARDTAGVLAGAGLSVLLLPQALPTPVLAFAVRAQGADAGVMITASHNPASDNGYKVYLRGGFPLRTPHDAEIAEHIASVDSVLSIPLSDGWKTADDSVIEHYLDAAAGVVSELAPRAVSVVYTPMHGVGGQTFVRVMQRAGWDAPVVVSEQFTPDPLFPSVAFPTPEEAGALDLAVVTATDRGADVVIAHDPDADRCAVALPRGQGYHRLSGDEVGWLLAWWTIERARRGWQRPLTGVVATTIVSSSLLGTLARDAGIECQTTLTGFKWLAAVADLDYAYEEALGYCVDPHHVRDKDGVTAALRVIEMVSTLKSEGRTVDDVLADLARRFGLHLTEQISVRLASSAEVDAVFERLSTAPITHVGPLPVMSIDNLADGFQGLPSTPGLRWGFGPRGRIIVRPSGTEPKLKAYVELITALPAESELTARDAAQVELADVCSALTTLIASPHESP